MNTTTIIVVSVGIAVLIFLACWVIFRRRGRDDDLFEDMDGEEFEEFCASLLNNQGFKDVELTGGSHDYGVDIFAARGGVTYAIQCKCYSDTVGIKAIQEVYAGRDFYDCMVGVVMTNQFFSKPAIEFAKKLNVLLWDGEYLEKLINHYGTGKESKYREIAHTERFEESVNSAEIRDIEGNGPAKEEFAENPAGAIIRDKRKRRTAPGDLVIEDITDDTADML